MRLNLKYPILLVHGMGFRDDLFFNYWGRVPKALEEAGASIFYGNQDAIGDIKTNAERLKETILEILSKTGAQQINIIAHSKGGLDSRYLISHLGMDEYVASLTTIATPHNGSKTVDFLLKMPDFIVRFVSFCANFWYRKFGDKKPDCYKVFHTFTTEKSRLFNENTPNSEKVYYQSFASVQKGMFGDILLWLPNLLVRWIEGENDGLLTPESVKWGFFKGILRSEGRRGVSHLDQIDLRRRGMSMSLNGEKTDIISFFMNVLKELEQMGY